MPKVVIAREGETLCSLAIRHGFLNCDQLRADPGNSAVLEKWLSAGDKVTIPDPRPNPQRVASGQSHRFRVKRRPEPMLRFVHGSKDKAYRDDETMTVLNISNYKSDMAGSTGAAAFTNVFGFDQDAHDDPDTFKLELVTPDGGNPVVRLQAMKPKYKADGSLDEHEEFPGAELAARQVDVECMSVDAKDPKRYRSRYLRLVADSDDQAACAGQALLVTDMADGNNGDNDKLEILDQRVRATHELSGCQAASEKCTLKIGLDVGERKRRIRMAIHIFRSVAGGLGIGGCTEQMVRRRTFKWFRRAYAQTNLGPTLVGPEVQFFDPPSADMIAISNLTGTPASGVDAAAMPSTLAFRLDSSPVAGGPAPPPGPVVNVPLATGWNATRACRAIQAALPVGYVGEIFTNCRSTNQAQPCADIIIRRVDGRRVIIRNEASTDTAATIDVARINIANVNASGNPFASLMVGTIEARRLLRFAGADDRLDMFVVGDIPHARGVAFLPATDLAPPFRPVTKCRWAALMRASVMNGADNDPFTYPHEAGHVLNDAFHVDNADPNLSSEMMTGAGTSPANAVGASKRISDDPIQVQYQKYDPAQAAPGDWHSVDIRPTRRFRARGAPVYEAW